VAPDLSAVSPLTVPAGLAETVGAAGPEGVRWIRDLPARVDELLRRWELAVDGQLRHGHVALVVPVRRLTGEPAALKVGWPHPEAEPEAAALRAWAGRGAVRLLDHDAEAWALLLERLDPDHDLDSLPDVEGACDEAALLLPALHAVDPPDEVPLVADLARDWEEHLLGRWERAHAPFPRRRAEEARELAGVLPAEGPVRLLHWDLHLANVLAVPGTEADPEGRWRAIDPKPLAGDPAAEALALLRNRDEAWAAASDPPAAIRGRLARVCESGGLDPDRARAWALLRAVVDHVGAAREGRTADARVLDALAAALATPRAF